MAALLAGCALMPAPTPTPTRTPGARPARATATPTRAALATATQLPPSPTQTASPTRTATVTATLLPPTATDTPLPTPTSLPTATPTPTATATVPPSPTSTRRPAPPATAVPTVSPLAARSWDPRLTQRGAQLIPAQAKAGQGYWRLIEAHWYDEGEAPFDGKHYIYVEARNPSGARQTGVRFQMASLDLSEVLGYVVTEAKPGELYAANFAMFVVAPAYRVEPSDGSLADAVSGLGLGSLTSPGLPTLTSYGFTWQWTIMR